jgi:hypothetical protein
VKDNSYLRAQRSYDAQLPDSGPDMDVCPACLGDCEVPVDGEMQECARCQGIGEINLDAEKAARREAYEEDKADEQRDESR